MSGSWCVLYLEIVVLKMFDPVSNLSLVAKVQQPPQCSVVCTNSELPSIRVVVKVMNRLHYGQQLLSGNPIVSLWSVKYTIVVCHNSLLSVLDL